MPLSSDQKLVELAHELVDADRAIAGAHPGFRPSHAKGIFFSGTFTPTTAAAKLSRGPHFQASVPVTARFSSSTGLPHIADAAPHAQPKALAVRFHLGDQPRRQHTDIVARSLDGFPVRTGAEFLELLRASKAGGDTLREYLVANPFAAAYVGQPQPTPASYAALTYWAVNAFVLVGPGPEGKHTAIRYRWVPREAGQTSLDAYQTARVGPDYLSDEIAVRVGAPNGAGAAFTLIAQVAGPDDPTDDATKIWPEAERELIDLGTLRLEKLLDQDAPEQERIIYDPLPRVDGIEPSDDPLLPVRNDVYLIAGRIRRKELQV